METKYFLKIMKIKSFYLAPDASINGEVLETTLLEMSLSSLTVPDATGDETYNEFFNQN